MGKSVKERLDETIKRDKREIAEEDNKMGIKGNKETNVEDFMNKKIKEMMDDGEQELEDDDEYDEFEEELEEEIKRLAEHHVQFRNELTCYERSLLPVDVVLKKQTGFKDSSVYKMLEKDIREFLKRIK